MYVGRIVAAGMTSRGEPVALYRVSSRSYAERTVVLGESRAEVTARGGALAHDSPFIYYGCYRRVDGRAVVGNGSHTDWIADKLAAGLRPRDALTATLALMDYENDAHATPRIAAVVCPKQRAVVFGAVSKDDLVVWSSPLTEGRVSCIATYEMMHRPDGVRTGALSALEPTDLAAEVMTGGIFAELEKPICGFAAVLVDGKWSTSAVSNP